ncbi:hypothetical protein [Nonomuraea sp. NPDC049709]|uniref:hypothetical protein n=1 Tax=Nonomuraea sp. NPDC049709 TaxID=3154736 RepID=UPI00343F2F56
MRAKTYIKNEANPTEHPKPQVGTATWPRIAPLLEVVRDLETLRTLVREAPSKGFEVAYYLARAAEEIGNDLGADRKALLEHAVLTGELPQELDF